MYVGGDFRVVGGVGARGIARYFSGSWRSVGDGVEGSVFSMAVSANRLHVVGSFSLNDGEAIGKNAAVVCDEVVGGCTGTVWDVAHTSAELGAIRVVHPV